MEKTRLVGDESSGRSGDDGRDFEHFRGFNEKNPPFSIVENVIQYKNETDAVCTSGPNGSFPERNDTQ